MVKRAPVDQEGAKWRRGAQSDQEGIDGEKGAAAK